LIELLVVIAIIAILAAMLMPALGKARESAHQVICLANEKSIAAALFLYASDFDGRIPPRTAMTAPYDFGPGELDSAWVNDSLNGDAFNCWGDFLLWAGLLTRKVFACPADDGPPSLQATAYDRAKMSYGILYNLYCMHPTRWGGQDLGTGGHWPPGSGPPPPHRYGPTVDRDILRPATSILFLDTRGNPAWFDKPGGNTDAGFWNWAAQGMVAHRGWSGNYAFFDGHAENLAWSRQFGRAFVPTLGDPRWLGWVMDPNLDLIGRAGPYATTGFPLWAPWE
jgi:prepilin-type processing-associated H-X9-DG protein